ncbi:MAG: hypothetical protein KDD24_01815 [Flavobacteriales bacterium]|nr:hypothetical protein [Flavobacteriales bacterium]MCB9173102.1 hypothetical protein [Flavobacteriales bacterium]
MVRILKIVFNVLAIISIIVVLGFAKNAQEKQVFNKNNLAIQIDYVTENRFVDYDDVKNEVTYLKGNGVKYFYGFNPLEIEKKIINNSAIKDAQVYKSIDGKLNIQVKQRRPIARIFTRNEGYYMDEFGGLMPLSDKYTSRIVVVSGYLFEPFSTRYQLNYQNIEDTIAKKTLLDDIYKLAHYIDESEFWTSQIEQVYVNKELEFELIPKVGNHKIVLGGVDNLPIKFNKLMVFYKKGLPKTGWNEYSEINLKYKNQIVCTKNYN